MFKKRIATFLVLIIGSLLIFNFSRNIIRLLQSERKIGRAQEEVERLRAEQEMLLKKREHYQSEEFIEEQARNKLSMAKEGEAIVVLPPSSEEVLGVKEEELLQEIPNWKKWLEVFGF